MAKLQSETELYAREDDSDYDEDGPEAGTGTVYDQGYHSPQYDAPQFEKGQYEKGEQPLLSRSWYSLLACTPWGSPAANDDDDGNDGRRKCEQRPVESTTNLSFSFVSVQQGGTTMTLL